MTEVATTSEAPSEAGVLAGELAKSFGRLVESYEQYYSLSREEAVRRAAEQPADGGQRALTIPPDQVGWCELHVIARSDPDRATARWEEVKRAALEELRTGYRAAQAVEPVGHQAWGRAQFLALRAELSAEWHPRNGIERQLLDTMAQAQAGYLYWLQNLTMRTTLESVTSDRRVKEEARWAPPRQSDADALEQSAAMMERFNRIFLRTQRALCDMRRLSKPVIVRNGAQVNVAQHQVNVAVGTAATDG
jgi:hypothetical protein